MYQEINRAIQEYIKDNWISTTVAYPNTILTVNESADFHTIDETWIRPSILFSTAQISELGTNGSYKVDGTIVIDLFAPLNTGLQKTADMMAELERLFNFRKRIKDEGEHNIYFTGTHATGSVDDQNGFYMTVVNCDFYTYYKPEV